MIRSSISILLLSVAAAPALAQTAPAARPAAQGPQPVSRAVFVQRIDGSFVATDANKDGFADRAELTAAQARQAAQSKAQAIRAREAAFRRLDANKDGTLTLQEFNSLAVAAPVPPANVAPILTRFDTNKDGRISLTENRAPAIANFDRADANKDGILTVAEQRALRR
jgi:hypothetical protein